MKIAVLGIDRRLNCLAGLLNNDGHEILTSSDGAELTICRWPVEESLCGGKTVTCGPQYAPDGMIDLLKDEEYQQKIAWMTAEGAVAAAMGMTGCAVRGAECMVVGWGRIGRALTRILKSLGGKVTVLSRRSDAFCEIADMGAKYGYTADAAVHISDKRFVFSTPPSMVIDDGALKNARKDSVVIDLASSPYGVNIEAAAIYGISAWREPGIPGRYCPENAARAIYEAIIERGLLDG